LNQIAFIYSQASALIFAVLAAMFPTASVAHQNNTANDAVPYPAIEILEAFRDGCGTIENQAAAAVSLASTGWQETNSNETDTLAQFLEFARTAGQEIVSARGGTMSEMQVFTQTIQEERIYIVLSEVEIDKVRVSGCRLFDFGETRQISVPQVVDWLNIEPVKIVQEDEVSIANWEPGLLAQHDSFQLFFVPSNSPLKNAFKFDGVALKSDTVGVVE